MMVHMALWESFCNVVHEGMSQGLVCIVANNTALPYLIKNKINGFLVKTKDSQMLSEVINYVLENQKSDEIKKIKSANLTFAKNHSWGKTAEKMNTLYQLLIK
jgi:glycosyltransferase involved in cell wall biosynthesis